VRKVLVAPAAEIAGEVYLSLLLDRDKRIMTFIGCAEGGVEIEETARTAPEKIRRLEVAEHELAELTAERCRPLADELFGDPSQQAAAADLMARMAHVFVGHDASLVEINPLVVTSDGQVLALDAKVLLDDNAAGRHPDHEALRDLDAEDADELEAKAAGLSFIRLDGDIGCMVNGAGLAMATMDIIKHYGGQPANFLDVGGSSSPDKVVTAFRIILTDPQVKVILVNIFGGITRCDDIARGILAAKRQFDVPVPVVVRLVGTNEVAGRALLEGTELTPAVTLDDGARTAIGLAGAA
jgi:succinyl-CoA synthetase beta subunit